MSSFHIFTDSSCDLPVEMQDAYDLKVMQLEVIIDGEEPVLNRDIEAKDFYQKLRDGANAKTAAVTPGYFEEHMRKSLEEGADILYIGFSSGLSTTYNSGAMILKELQEEFPERKMFHIDTLCASVGQGLLVHYAALQREAGKSIEEVYEGVMEMKDKVHHQVTVDDLFFLQRGGRVSATAAVAGSILNIKPMIVVTSEGKLENVAKARGRKKGMKELVEYMKATADVEAWKYVFISHGDCLEEAEVVKAMVEEEYPGVEVIISDVGPVIGAHTGPGVIALCHMGRCTKGTEYK
ncbi:MAG: DegV family protein [Lachnospiraceae bacterium]|nr:DegV family protein [Lachnospiraceae bacterium]